MANKLLAATYLCAEVEVGDAATVYKRHLVMSHLWRGNTDSSDLGHFGPKTLQTWDWNTLAPVLKCLLDTSALAYEKWPRV